MKKSGLILMAIAILFMPLALAADAPITVSKTDISTVVIPELSNGAVYELSINNSGPTEKYELFTYVAITLDPQQKFTLPAGNSNLEIKAYPKKSILEQKGNIAFQYHLFGEKSGLFTDILNLKIVPFKEVFEMSSPGINPQSSTAQIVVRNTQNVALDEVQMHFSSKFFSEDKTFSIKPLEEATLELPVKKEISKDLVAGSYEFTATSKTSASTTTWVGVIQYLEMKDISTEKETSGFIIRKNEITQTNNGNVQELAHVEITKNVLTRLFTVHSIQPDSTKRNGLLVKYTWEKEIAPTESIIISTTTNYTFPFILIIIIIGIAVLVSIALRTSLMVQKKVSFVKTRGGEFALKVSIHIKAHKTVEKVTLTDRVPSSMHIYEKMSGHPHRIDASSRTMHWEIPHLSAGEERVYSYIMYSKMRVVGRFELPFATASFTHDEKQESVTSNRAIFMSETMAHSED